MHIACEPQIDHNTNTRLESNLLRLKSTNPTGRLGAREIGCVDAIIYTKTKHEHYQNIPIAVVIKPMEIISQYFAYCLFVCFHVQDFKKKQIAAQRKRQEAQLLSLTKKVPCPGCHTHPARFVCRTPQLHIGRVMSVYIDSR